MVRLLHVVLLPGLIEGLGKAVGVAELTIGAGGWGVHRVLVPGWNAPAGPGHLQEQPRPAQPSLRWRRAT